MRALEAAAGSLEGPRRVRHTTSTTKVTCGLLLAALYIQLAASQGQQQQQQQQHQPARRMAPARWPTEASVRAAPPGETKRPLPAGPPHNSTAPRAAANEWIPLRPRAAWSQDQDQEVVATAASFGRRHWRRPRFHRQHLHHEPVRKLYRRVLLCEKTLVSLDYLRLQPGAGPDNELADDDDDFLDNFIDNSAEPSLRRLGRQLPHLPRANLSARDTLQARSYLTDEDPLVKCDMWDLEKGLKSRKPPEEALRMAVRADFDTVRDAINRCRQLTEKTLPPDDEFGRDSLEVMSTDDLASLFSMKRGLIPGTKWCGLGDQASSYNDLGPKHRIDICCRAHDHCPIRLKPFRNDYGVLNLALYTKSHCDCDADFYRCLREAHSRTADMLGNLYFNVMKLQCMREERQKVCREMKPLPLGFERCVRYEDSPVKRVFRFTGPPVAY